MYTVDGYERYIIPDFHLACLSLELGFPDKSYKYDISNINYLTHNVNERNNGYYTCSKCKTEFYYYHQYKLCSTGDVSCDDAIIKGIIE